MTTVHPGLKIKQARKNKRLTQAQLAHEVELDTGNISRIENGKQGVSLPRLRRFAAALGVPISELVDAESAAGLDDGVNDPQLGAQGRSTPAALGKAAPLVPWGRLCKLDWSKLEDIRVDWHPVSISLSKRRVLATQWDSDSMSTKDGPLSFAQGTVLVFSECRDDEVSGGDFVLVEDQDGSPMFKQLVVDGSMRLLRSMNTAYPTRAWEPGMQIKGVLREAIHRTRFD